jgi:hypothetical protein
MLRVRFAHCDPTSRSDGRTPADPHSGSPGRIAGRDQPVRACDPLGDDHRPIPRSLMLRVRFVHCDPTSRSDGRTPANPHSGSPGRIAGRDQPVRACDPLGDDHRPIPRSC